MLEHTTHGEAGPWLVLVHGWPDDARLWQPLIPHLVAAGYRCAAVTLPAFPTSDATSGADFPELVTRLRSTVDALTDEPVVVVGHDWGAFLTYLFERDHPERVDRVVTLDVGAHFEPSGLGHAVFMVTYQGWLVAAWMGGRVLPPLGDWMTRSFARSARAPRPEEVGWRANYPYAYVWRALLVPGFSKSLPSGYRPTHPTLYLYGTKKPFMFHSPKWLDIVRRIEGSEVVAVDAAGHWLQVDRPDEVAAHVVRWLERRPATSS